MIGNDIIDLKLAAVQSNWQRKGWLHKIFTGSEQKTIWDANDPNHMIWKLWSMKEAAYKAHQRCFSLSPKYNPWDFICTDNKVVTQNKSYQTISKYTEDYIYTIAYSDAENTNFVSKVFTGAQDQYKRILQNYIADIKGVNLCDVTLQKDNRGIPDVKICNQSSHIPLSLSSHGSFSAFAIDL
ncbi:4'-phosphopantetheinyl transferase superfamily protein [Aquimarina rubra]|uniref:4'-phosphopantetheinyl transferase superfamily protein n=1 Tax=Aquimarina rubra TaxID=1920033 RepID=A0ABW5LBK9_9FLAO